jgi:Flp pilus assembly protein TadD
MRAAFLDWAKSSKRKWQLHVADNKAIQRYNRRAVDAGCLYCIGKFGMILTATAALSACETVDSQPVGYESRVSVAERMLERGQFSGAYTLLDDVSSDHATNGAAHARVGQAYLNNRAFNKAEASFRSAIQLGAQTKGYIGLGRVALARNDASNARKIFLAVLQDDLGNVDAMNGIGVAYDLVGQHDLAREQYMRILQLHPGRVETLNNLALSHVLGGDAAYAASILHDLTESQLDDPGLRQNYALALYVSGHTNEAMRLATVDMTETEAIGIFNAVIAYRRARS